MAINLMPAFGAYPTMITPYNKNKEVDYGAVENLVEWYWKNGCDGIFASCQSSEIWFLGLEDRVKLAAVTKRKADELAAADKSRKPMTVIASGHVSNSPDNQEYELNRIADTGVDAVVLITNRLDIANTTDEMWISDAEKLIDKLPDTLPLGVYECPMPYKRLLTEKILAWCVSAERFAFIKDTCCSAAVIDKRCKQIEGSTIKLFNANAQTLLDSLKSGAWGYSGVMANFHPKLYKWLCDNFRAQPEKAAYVQSFLCLAAFLESLAYPVIAKYHQNDLENVAMEYYAKSCNCALLTDYQKSCVRQMKLLSDKIESEIGVN